MALDLAQLANKVQTAKAAEATEAFKALPSGIYPATITAFGTYTNSFNSDSIHIGLKIGEQDFSIDRGLTLKDGKDNEGTLSLLKEVFAATGIDIATAQSAPKVIKAFGKDVQLTNWVETNGKEVNAYVRETFDESKGQYAKGNQIENIFNTENKNSAGEDQSTKFLEKIAEQPVLVKKQRQKTQASQQATNSASNAAARI